MSSLHDALDRMALPGLGPRIPETVASSFPICLEPEVVLQRPERGGSELIAVAAMTWCFAGVAAKTRLLIAALSEHHPEIDIFVLLLDEPSAELSAFFQRHVAVRPVPIVSLGLFRLDFLRFKLGPAELAEFVKPAMGLKTGALGYEKILSIDPDYGIFAPLTSLLAALDQEPFVMVPRRLEPPRQGWGEAREVGALSSALFAFVPGEPSRGWLELWQEALESPGAFLPSPGGNVFEWWNRFPAAIAVLRDPAYGVSRTNLDERALRWLFLDGAAEPGTFSVNGRPLVAFHFAALEKEDPWRAQFGGSQPTLYLLPSLSALFDLRLRQWEEEGGPLDLVRAEENQCLRGGIRLDARLRRLVQRHEAVFLRELDPFSAEGVDSFGRLLFWPAPGTFFVPALLWEIYLERTDLQVAFPEARITPDRLIAWFCAHGATELDYLPLLDRFRPTLPRREGLLHLYQIVKAAPAIFRDLAAPLGRDRQAFIDRLMLSGYVSEARGVEGLDAEMWVLCRLATVRRLVETRPDLQQSFPDYLGENLENLATWLDTDGVHDHDLPPRCGELLRRKAGGRALGRIYSFYRRYPWLQERYPAAFSGEGSAELATAILERWPADCEFDHDDVVFFLWEMAKRPRHALLGFAPHGASQEPTDSSSGAGINCFGYFRSPIGLGNLSRGLARALEAGGFPVARQVVGCPEMDTDLALADFFGSFRDDFTSNIFVSYPHLHQHLLKAEPPSRVFGRRNIVYLAWEQRDFHPFWKEVFTGFDQVWAISSFAAESLRRALGREVLALPAVLDFNELPPPARPEEVGLDPERCTFLYVFDVFSALERKNPLGAIEAFRRAFRRDDRVELRLKASHGERPEHWSQLRRLLEAAARTGLRITFERRRLPRRELLRLISAASAYVSLHRAEGFGYTCAEAMAYGVPVIATGYSGNLDFMDENSARLVRYREVEVEVPDGPFQRGSVWAEPELDHAAELMRWVYEERAAAGALGARGARRVREKLAPGAMAQLLRKALGDP